MGRRKNGKELDCFYCEKKFYRVPSHIVKTNFCSRKCSDKGRSRENLRQLGKSQKEREERSNYMKTAWANGSRNNNALIQESKSIEGRKRRSENLLRQYRDSSKTIPMTSGHYSTVTIYNGIRMRSKLEARYAESLDRQNIKWEYEPQRFELKELNCTYTPDFYLPELNMYSEVKGWDQGLEKVEVFKKMGYNIRVIRDKDIE